VTRETARLQGLLLVLGPTVLLLSTQPGAPWPWLPAQYAMVVPILVYGTVAAGLLIGAAALPTASVSGRIIVTLAALLGAAALAVTLRDRPPMAFVELLLVGLLLVRVWPMADPRAAERPPTAAAVHGAASATAGWIALGSWWLAVPLELASTPLTLGAAAVAQVLAAWLAARVHLAREPGDRMVFWPLVAWPTLVAGVLLLSNAPGVALTLLAIPSVLRLALSRIPTERLADLRALWTAGLVNPARALVIGFGATCLLGGVLLALPAAGTSRQPVEFLDALFTSVSAVCVTGLIVVDTPHVYSLFGQAVILALFQIGGLGIMTLSAAAVALLGMRVSVHYESAAAGLVGAEGMGRLEDSLWRMFLITAISEGVGAALLAGLFAWHGDAAPVAVWRGLFTSVSAFCNAGFALQTDSLIPYQHSPAILLVVGTLIVIGGLGPVAVWAIPTWARGRRVALGAKLALVITAVLLVGVTGLFLLTEWNSSLAGFGIVDKLSNAWFQSVTLRTCGFNSIDLTRCGPAIWLVMILAMFVGGSPGGTAGGVKTTTMGVLLLAVVASLRGRPEAIGFGRRVSHRSVYQAAAIATAGLGTGAFLVFAVLLTQPMPLHVAIYEVVSALGTVGLTLGGTPLLDEAGKMLIMMGMFIGRIGPLTLFLFLTSRTIDRDSGLPEERVVVG